MDPSRTPTLFLLLMIGGYALVTWLYLKVHYEWMKRSKPGERRKSGNRRKVSRGLLDEAGVLLLGLAWAAGIFFFPDSKPLQVLAPLYVLARMGVGALWGNNLALPLPLLARELLHALVFLGITWATWS